MRIVQSVAAMQRLALGWKRTGQPIALVPTMGFLHDGHSSLVARARRLVGSQGIVSLSIYVNPAQFAATEDLSKYPRNLPADIRKCRAAGVDLLFAPSDQDMYPREAEPAFGTWVEEQTLSTSMEGASRPGHFRGVTTVVAKLFNIVLPDHAVFGAKDFQQAAVIRKMSRDLNFPVKITVNETLRESDGVAMSSRNLYLSPAERAQATVLYRSIQTARCLVREQPVPASRIKARIRSLASREPGARLDYVELFDPKNLHPVMTARPGVQLALAVFIGKTRLIDNAVL